MQGLIRSSECRDFWVWVDPFNPQTHNNVTVAGSFCSLVPDRNKETLMFLPNPKFKGSFVGVFQNNLLRKYIAEYNLELGRQSYFPDFPSRLHSIFLFDSESDAQKYRDRHHWHVGSRVLKRAKTSGWYCYSSHDSSWVDFLHIGGSMDPQTIDRVSQAYWSGKKVEQIQLQSMGKSWTQSAIIEILFLGRIDFYDRILDA